MKRSLFAAAALVLLATSAQAKMFTLHQGKYWQTFATVNTDAGPQCGIYYGSNIARFYIKWTQRYGMRVQLWKRNWRLAENAEVPFKMNFRDDAKPDDNQILNAPGGWAVPSDAYGTSVFANIEKDDEAKLLAAFSDADRIAIHFPEGDEPSWSVKGEGSRKAASEFTKCISQVQQTAGTQPVKPQPVKPTQPTGKASVKDDGGI